MFDGQFRSQAETQLRPIGTTLRKAGITADHLTILGVIMAAAASVSGTGCSGITVSIAVSSESAKRSSTDPKERR